MKKFKYIAVDKNEQKIITEIKGRNEFEVVDLLHLDNLHVISLQSMETGFSIDPESSAFKFKRMCYHCGARIRDGLYHLYDEWNPVSEHALYLFTRQLATLLSAGVNIASGINTILTSEQDSRFKNILASVASSIMKGHSLAQCFALYPTVFSRTYTGLVEVGISSGQLPAVLERHANDLEKFYSFKRKIIASLTYPGIILAFAIIAISIMMLYFVPAFTRVYMETKMKLPFLTSALIFCVNTLLNPTFWLVAIPVLLLSVYFIRSYLKTVVGRYTADSIALKLPMIGDLIAQNYLYQIFLNLACMLQCGVQISQALAILRDMTRNVILKDSLTETIEGIRNGEEFHKSLGGYRFIPRFAVDLIQTGESTGELPDMARKAAQMIEEQVNSKLETFLHLVEPAIISFLALVVGIILIATFLPLYSIINAFS